MFQLQKLEEERVNSIHHERVQKQQQKYWHDKNLKTKHILAIDLVLLYDCKVKGKLVKLEIAWQGPYIIEEMNSSKTTGLKMLQERVFTKVINESRLKKYHP